jgi:hypothetical protein
MTRAVAKHRNMMRSSLIGVLIATSGCVSISAPDRPIEINLNINVTQQVVYRLDSQAKSLIEKNPGIF